MAIPMEPPKSYLLVSILYSPMVDPREPREELVKLFGEEDVVVGPWNFDHTNYYEKEMGKDLNKVFLSFENLISSEQLVEIKLFCIELEEQFSYKNRRRVNIDPGYLELSKLVLASTKNYDHRIHLGKGVYGDVQLRFRGGQFVTNPWTYPDYQTSLTMEFFTRVRQKYHDQLKQLDS
ncbi:MAG: DUF4416 family protein [Calditrichaeota bacterium]|nr:MAG: DUF4416 family protein [Calditrichota bacterium]